MNLDEIKSELDALQRKDRLDSEDVSRLNVLQEYLRKYPIQPSNPEEQNSVKYEIKKAIYNMRYPESVQGWKRQKEWCRLRNLVMDFLDREEGESDE